MRSTARRHVRRGRSQVQVCDICRRAGFHAKACPRAPGPASDLQKAAEKVRDHYHGQPPPSACRACTSPSNQEDLGHEHSSHA
jgi:hypothetical protein